VEKWALGEPAEPLRDLEPAASAEDPADRLHHELFAAAAGGLDGLRAQVQQHARDVDLDRADLVAGTAKSGGERK
jgi:hypothetical protein